MLFAHGPTTIAVAWLAAPLRYSLREEELCLLVAKPRPVPAMTQEPSDQISQSVFDVA